jgi:hypothetical protein
MSSGVEFDEDNFSYSAKPRVQGIPAGANSYVSVPRSNGGGDTSNIHGIAGFLIRHGIAKSYNSAQVIMIAIVIVNIVVTFIVVHYLI